MTQSQCHAVWGSLAWTQAELATRPRVHQATVRGFELGRKEPIRVSQEAIQRAFTAAGIVFVVDPERGEGVFLARGRADDGSVSGRQAKGKQPNEIAGPAGR